MHPTLFHLGNISLPTFGVVAAIGLMCGLLLSERTAKIAAIEPARLWNAGLFAVIAAFVVSRTLLAALQWRSFLEFPILLLAAPSLTAPGLFLTLVATLLWLRLKQVPLRRALDAWAPCATLVWAFLALGHFAEGSDPGMLSRFHWRHPVALYAAALAMIITAAAFGLLLRSRSTGETAALTLIAVGLGQFLLSFLRVPGIELIAGLDQLQCVALAMIAIGVTLLVTRPAPIPAILD